MTEYLLGVSAIINVSFLYLFYLTNKRIEAARWNAAMAHRRITLMMRNQTDDGK
jgi:hypothetical protein